MLSRFFFSALRQGVIGSGTCETGREGDTCARCKPTYFTKDDECVSCDEATSAAGLFTMALFIVALALAGMALFFHKDPKNVTESARALALTIGCAGTENAV